MFVIRKRMPHWHACVTVLSFTTSHFPVLEHHLYHYWTITYSAIIAGIFSSEKSHAIVAFGIVIVVITVLDQSL